MMANNLNPPSGSSSLLYPSKWRRSSLSDPVKMWYIVDHQLIINTWITHLCLLLLDYNLSGYGSVSVIHYPLIKKLTFIWNSFLAAAERVGLLNSRRAVNGSVDVSAVLTRNRFSRRRRRFGNVVDIDVAAVVAKVDASRSAGIFATQNSLRGIYL